MTNNIKTSTYLFFGLLSVGSVQAQNSLQQYQNVNFSRVQITDNFWKP
ncbi:MAG: hypothetical protein ICV81_14675, partial [Flavisolibacter sp.]|nr:hypothetical protein [Flavisolibacter sp.]